jgi:hypothetical protein
VLLERLRRRLIAVVEAVDAFIQQQLMDCGPDDNARGATFGLCVVTESTRHQWRGANHGNVAQSAAAVDLKLLKESWVQDW